MNYKKWGYPFESTIQPDPLKKLKKSISPNILLPKESHIGRPKLLKTPEDKRDAVPELVAHAVRTVKNRVAPFTENFMDDYLKKIDYIIEKV